MSTQPVGDSRKRNTSSVPGKNPGQTVTVKVSHRQAQKLKALERGLGLSRSDVLRRLIDRA